MPTSSTPGAAEIEAVRNSPAYKIATEVQGGGTLTVGWKRVYDIAEKHIATMQARAEAAARERDEAVGNCQHAIHQAEALAARVVELQTDLEIFQRYMRAIRQANAASADELRKWARDAFKESDALTHGGEHNE